MNCQVQTLFLLQPLQKQPLCCEIYRDYILPNVSIKSATFNAKILKVPAVRFPGWPEQHSGLNQCHILPTLLSPHGFTGYLSGPVTRYVECIQAMYIVYLYITLKRK
jgi:hypothetical protein